ncbi:MAG: peptidoglycan bridge formation glycyltransferase FemA/FemB family protein [bacterium]
MKIISGDNLGRAKWDEFVKTNSSDFGLLQLNVWKDFQEVQNKKVFQLAVIDESEQILAVAQIIKSKLPLGKSYFYLPRGPVVNNKNKKEIIDFLFSEIKKIAKQENAIFLRLEPAWQESEENISWLKNNNFKSIGQIQPKSTLVLDLLKSEEDLLQAMKPKTRYNIRVAQKHCIKIDEGKEYFEAFWNLMKNTSERDQFVSHQKEYYQKMLEVLSETKNLKLLVAKDGDKVIATNLVVYSGDWCVYLHGASDYSAHEKMAPYLLQWETILQAKAHECLYYDFWGVDEIKWPGVSRFKIGFAPNTQLTKYVGAYDLSYEKFWHQAYVGLRKFKK